MSLYIKSGSIIPLGPQVQYANEKIAPIDLRVYSGKDVDFVYYDDEKDDYD